ncbi:MAG TPA: hypothetical protein VI248_09795 [Kineosporiaceae bacterium]
MIPDPGFVVLDLHPARRSIPRGPPFMTTTAMIPGRTGESNPATDSENGHV